MRPLLKITSYLLLAALVLAGGLDAKTIWTDKNIYSSGENLKVGDIIAVNIDDISQMRFTMALTDRNDFSISSNPDRNVTGFLPNVNSTRKVTSAEKTDVAGKGNLKITIGSRITGRRADGKFNLAGNRDYSFNGVASRFAVTGIIDPDTVKGRSVNSRDMADFRLVIRGFKEGAAGLQVTRPPLKEGEAASPALTEEEKQKIITDYLNKMLGELSR